VAIDAVLRNLLAQLGIFSALLRLVAAEAMHGIGGCISLLEMNVVAGRAGHGAGEEAFALSQQLHLVPMNVDCLTRRRYGNFQVFAKV
jgi:hypothetical protein